MTLCFALLAGSLPLTPILISKGHNRYELTSAEQTQLTVALHDDAAIKVSRVSPQEQQAEVAAP